ncbi:UDP-N-acetylglucosamine 1-carboxyvinyltransferase [Egicoccus halophilus]|uniref:UDP-N-acetylglucosamine 1-carboxyvinyltransferase n=1 Tax=Egicoccus halophilus TaxID=1670830 RepID=A0A8J3A7Q3_9ACTN|nr:UDP-N-acetylglucosamine 1-carboxyvinyltransferase [Egicoccus halophilus]GGI04047.1 UDP-N-acetylglucosamine 1-carboxyvinyltransferase [Egicoccus halophilus]
MLDPTSSTDVFVVRGGAPLRGTVRLSGAKNSALKLMAAGILCDGTLELGAIPRIADVPVMAEVLRGIGLGVDLDLANERCTIDASVEPDWRPPRDAVTRIRASISCLGPLVGRTRRARIALPGGDKIGARRIEMHVRGLMAMGAEVEERADEVEVVARELHGAILTLDFPSVGATENLVMAAVLADGTTVLDNAAREPEIQDLCRMLVAMGARIDGIGSPTLEIEGVDRLAPISWETCPDRIEAGTYAVAAALTGGDVVIERVRPADLTLPLLKLRSAGVVIEEGGDSLRVKAGDLDPVDFVTLPYPGFPTDLQPQMMVLLTQAEGTSRCTENVFESRFSFVDELARMGADIQIDGHHALIRGPAPLVGATFTGLDVRAGAAGTLAGLVARGTTVVRDVHHVDRGYADWIPRLQALGADVERVPASDVDA